MSAIEDPDYELGEQVRAAVDGQELLVTLRTEDDDGWVVTPEGGGQRRIKRADILGRPVDLEAADPTPLSTTEAEELQQREARCREAIHRGQRAAFDLGVELGEIRDRKLYRGKSRTSFEAYLSAEFGLSRQYGYGLIDFARKVGSMSARADIAVLPEGPRQRRALDAAGDQDISAWTLALSFAEERAGEGAQPTVKETERAVGVTVSGYHGREVGETVRWGEGANLREGVIGVPTPFGRCAQAAAAEAPTPEVDPRKQPVKTAAQIAAERTETPGKAKPGALKSAEERVAERQPAAPPEPPKPQPVTAVISAALADRLAELGGGVLSAVRTWIRVAELAEEHEIEPVTAIDLLERFLSCAARMSQAPDAILDEWEARLPQVEAEGSTDGE